MVVSIGKLGQGQANYYLKAVAQGVEDYYTGAGEAPGRWVGSAARELGIGGAVADHALHAALSGVHPRTGDPLAERRGGTRIAGFDVTCSAPKSVSVLYGLSDEGLSAEVCAAHETAVDGALDYIERQAAVARRGAGGADTVAGGADTVAGNGFLAAAFRHRSSRAGDPQLHTHVLVANMTKAGDGRWTALDARHLYAHAKTAGYLYQAQLRAELSRRLGVEWTEVHKGVAEIEGVPAPVMRAFSRRRAEIERTLAERGEHSQSAARVAALDTRRAKDYGVEPESLRQRWRDQARQLGCDRGQLEAIIGRPDAHQREPARTGTLAAELASPQGLTAKRSSFTRRDVIQATCERLPGADAETAEHFADAFLASEHAVPLATDIRQLTYRDVIQRADGRVVPATAGERRHSTPELLAIERRLIEGALARQDERSGVVSARALDAALARRPTLGVDQAAMVRRLTRDGFGVQVVTGKAGTGKTFALDAARAAWQADGYRVIGAAVARRAARELEDGAGIESTSLAALLHDLRMGGEYGLPPHSVVVLDEAGMAGTRQLAELLDHTEAASAKVALVGDPHQLPEIDAGGAFRALLLRTDPIELIENRRQREAWEHAALDDLRAGRPDEAISAYRRHGRITLGEGAQDVRERLVADWWQVASDGDAAMIALRRADVADLNQRARALMRSNRRLGTDELRVGEREFAVGDHVVTLKNARQLDVVNGTRGVITAVDHEAVEIAVQTHDGRELLLPRSYLDAETERGGPTLDHGYALTGHKAQGMTTARSFVLGTDDLYREWGYVAMSRGSEENRLYVVAPHARERDEYAPREQRRDPFELVIASLERSDAQAAAIDIAAREEVARMPTADLVAERTRLAEHLTEDLTRGDQLERMGGQRVDAERAAARARQRLEELGSGKERRGADAHRAAAEHAFEAQARGRVDQLTPRQQELTEHRAPRPLSERARDGAHYTAIGAELDRRWQDGARIAAIERPEHLLRALGPYPDRRSERRAWDRAARQVEDYRSRFGIEDAKNALGEVPQEVQQRSARREAQRAVDRAVRELGRSRARHRSQVIDRGR
jgi:conjugative relaxase-like TrwC/TraI family protein